jgi:hypothetical protein
MHGGLPRHDAGLKAMVDYRQATLESCNSLLRSGDWHDRHGHAKLTGTLPNGTCRCDHCEGWQGHLLPAMPEGKGQFEADSGRIALRHQQWRDRRVRCAGAGSGVGRHPSS